MVADLKRYTVARIAPASKMIGSQRPSTTTATSRGTAMRRKAISKPRGARMAFGQPLNTYHNLTNAKVIVSLDSDFLQNQGGIY